MNMNCKGPQTNSPKNVGSKEALMNKNIPRRHIGRTTIMATETAVDGYTEPHSVLGSSGVVFMSSKVSFNVK